MTCIIRKPILVYCFLVGLSKSLFLYFVNRNHDLYKTKMKIESISLINLFFKFDLDQLTRNKKTK